MSGTTGARVGASNIQWLPVAKLIPYARNARTHTDAQVAQIAASIREFGFNNPVLVDAEGGIIAGHGRVMAARKLGMADVPTITLPHLSDTQKRAFILADNRIALNAGWDDDLLAIELTELNIDGFSLDILGFTQEEIDGVLNADEPASVSPKVWTVDVDEGGPYLFVRVHVDPSNMAKLRDIIEREFPDCDVAVKVDYRIGDG
jgi:hypothetical protein